LSLRRFRLLAPVLALSVLTACATARAARTYPPATAEQQRDALAAWTAVRERAASLSASRLLYDATMASGSAPSIPGTLAVTYDGRAVVVASLTGPFGSHIAEYKSGEISGKDRGAFLVDPEALRGILAGAWSGGDPTVEGCDAEQCLMAWTGASARVEAVVDVATRGVKSMRRSAPSGSLQVDYAGKTAPWPERISVKEEKGDRSLDLRLVAVEPMERGAGAGR
jgi:hypothetical protein